MRVMMALLAYNVCICFTNLVAVVVYSNCVKQCFLKKCFL